MGCTASSSQPRPHQSDTTDRDPSRDQNNSGTEGKDHPSLQTSTSANQISPQTSVSANQTSSERTPPANQSSVQATNQASAQTFASPNQPPVQISVPANETPAQTALQANETCAQQPDSHPAMPSPHCNQGNKKPDPSSGMQTSSENVIETSTVTKVPEKGVNNNGKVVTMMNMPSTNSRDEEGCLPLLEDQLFNANLKFMNLLTSPESCFAGGKNNHVRKLTLIRALPYTVDLFNLVSKLENLQVLDVSNNQLGPQSFRLLMLALSSNSSLTWLNAANNMADTDSSMCIGRMLTNNATLEYLDVSGNHLGKDYFSRCMGPILQVNTSLTSLRLDSIGATDMTCLLEGLTHNSTLTDLDIGNNDIADGESVGELLNQCLQKIDCALTHLSLKNCNMSPKGVDSLREGLKKNSSLVDLNVNGNEFGSLDLVVQFIAAVFGHPSLQMLTLNEVKVKDQTIVSDIPVTMVNNGNSTLTNLSLCNASLNTDLFTTLEGSFKGRLLSLTDVNLSDNPHLSPQCIQSFVTMTTREDGHSCLTRLTYGLNNAETLPEALLSQNLVSLNYLNLRKAKISPAAVGKLSPLVSSPNGSLSTLVLDGLKLAGTDALKVLLGNSGCSPLAALSLGGCLLSDADLSPLTSAIKSGLQLQMLKLSANRITDKCLIDLVPALMSHKVHPLSVLDLNNQVGDVGAESLVKLFQSEDHTTQLHSLNLSHNNIGKQGLSQLMSVVGDKLRTIHLNNQRQSLEEAEITQVFTHLLTSLGVAVERDAEGKIVTGSCDLPRVPEGFFVNLSNLGGHVGDLGRALDCGSVVTDYRQKQVPHLTLEHVCQLASKLRSGESDHCTLSHEEWDLITGCQKDREIPSWLQVAESRDRAVFLTHLPGTTTARRLEGLFETEADSNIEEIYLMKDAVSRKFNGVSWVLMSDKDSVQRLVDYFLRGEAQIFGQPFTVSRLKVKVDDIASSEVEAQARKDMERRSRERRADDAAHRSLIQQSADESWKRHAYRLAHPAYADGRIW